MEQCLSPSVGHLCILDSAISSRDRKENNPKLLAVRVVPLNPQEFLLAARLLLFATDFQLVPNHQWSFRSYQKTFHTLGILDKQFPPNPQVSAQ